MNGRAFASRVVLPMVVGLLIVMAAPLLAQAPQGGQGDQRRRGMQSMMYLERSWAAVNFDLKATKEQLAKLKPAYQAAWDARKAAMAKAREAQDWQAMGAAAAASQKQIEAKLKEVLTKEQMAQWQQSQQRRGGRPRGGGQGGG